MTGLVQNVAGRVRLSLAGAWQRIVDPYEAGSHSPFGGENTRGWFRNFSARDESDLVEYDFARSPVLEVPGDWNSQERELLYYEGAVWYQRDLELSLGPDERAFLCFGAANYAADVWLDGRSLGRHEGGFTPFAFEVSEPLRRAGRHFVVVKVDSTRRSDAVPGLSTDWWNYGGLTRDVDLIRVPETFVRGYRVQLSAGRLDRLVGSVALDGPNAAGATVELRVPEADLEVELVTDAHGRAELEIAAPGLELWSPDSPRLYDVELRAPLGAARPDSVRDRIGFRSLGTRGSQILLNGSPIFLRGISLHEEAPLREGRARGHEDARVLMDWAQELGCNFVRLAHYPHDEHTVRLADERGLLVWAELPVYWQLDWENPRTLETASRQLEELIQRDQNRACVALWSVGNEAPASAPRLRFMGELAAHARRLDPTRLITAALLTIPGSEARMHVDDPLGEALDVIGVNEYFGWYYGAPEDAEKVEWSSAFDKPLILSELGAGARQGLRGSETQRWTEEFQARVYRHQIAMLREIPFLAGLSPWILCDFRSPRRTLPGIQDGYNRKGLISDRGIRKQAFYVLRDFYRELASRTRGETK